MKKLNNSGFSLIELIIVMAIMAILTVAVAPQYLKYVERSRKSVDVQTMATIISAIDIYAADPVVGGLTDATDTTLVLKQGDVTTVLSESETGYNFIHAALRNAGITSVEIKSKQWCVKDTDTLDLLVDVVDGVPTYDIGTTQKVGLNIIKGDTEITDDEKSEEKK